MMQRSTPSTQPHSFSSSRLRSSGVGLSLAAVFTSASLAAAVFLAAAGIASAQDATAPTQDSAAPAAASSPSAAQTTDQTAQPKPDISLSNQKTDKKKSKQQAEEDKKAEKIVPSKATKKVVKKDEKVNALEGMDAKLPDKALYDKAEDAVKHGRFDVARLDLQTLLNTYPETQFQMRAKLAIADSWYKEGGSAALTQAEQEYTDFITFFPNVPEAAEAQMRIGDIYFRQMDKPDRDNINTVKAENAYRQMLQQFPDSTLVPQAKQRLREVQEALASAESDVASFYAGRGNLGAAIARYQTVVDTYPLYSHMDDVLIGLGDAWEAQAKFVRSQNLPEFAKSKLLKIDEDNAYADFAKVVIEHSAAPHVEDARDRIAAMNRPVPTPTAEQAAASAALENSRGQYTLSKRATLLFLHQADTVPAATIGEPPLEDVTPTLAPTVYRKVTSDYNDALNPTPAPHPGTPIPAVTAPADAAAPATPPAGLSFQDVPASSDAATATTPITAPAARAAGGSSMGIEIVQPGADSSATTPPGASTAFPASDAAAKSAAAAAGIPAVGPADATPLPPVEKAAPAPAAINEVTPGSTPPAQTAPADGKKKPKAPCDKSDQSCSTHKPKKGLDKLNPF